MYVCLLILILFLFLCLVHATRKALIRVPACLWLSATKKSVPPVDIRILIGRPPSPTGEGK